MYLSYSSYVSMNLDIFNNSSIKIFYTSSHILVRLNLQDLISNYQEELLLSKAIYFSDFVDENKFVEDKNNSKLTHFSSKN